MAEASLHSVTYLPLAMRYIFSHEIPDPSTTLLEHAPSLSLAVDGVPSYTVLGKMPTYLSHLHSHTISSLLIPKNWSVQLQVAV
jgi:hypothetical protein